MKLLFVGLIFIGSLFTSATVQAVNEPAIGVVSIECKGNCSGVTLGQLCSQTGSTFRPIGVDCTNVRDQDRAPSEVPCGDNDRCFQRIMSPDDQLSTYCDDSSGWDAQVYCEAEASIQKTYPGTMCQPFAPLESRIQYDPSGRVINIGNPAQMTCPLVRDNTVIGTARVSLRVIKIPEFAVSCTLFSLDPNGNEIARQSGSAT